jgi:hypothetical protein
LHRARQLDHRSRASIVALRERASHEAPRRIGARLRLHAEEDRSAAIAAPRVRRRTFSTAESARATSARSQEKTATAS